MNKMILKILVILGLIAPVCADAVYKRIDSPGVAQRKLNLHLRGVRSMSEADQEQALADLSPTLKENYQEILREVNNTRAKNLESALSFIMDSMGDSQVNQTDTDKLFSDELKAYKLSPEQMIKLKKFINDRKEDKGTDEDKGSDKEEIKNEDTKVKKDNKEEKNKNKDSLDLLNEDQEEEDQEKEDQEEEDQEEKESKAEPVKKDEINKEDEEKFSAFLSELKQYFQEQLTDNNRPYKVDKLVTNDKNRFETKVKRFEKNCPIFNSFFMNLQKYQNQRTYSIACIQDAFSASFFKQINFFYKLVVKNKNSEDIANLYFIMDKCDKILQHNTATGILGTNIKILNKEETNNHNQIIANRKDYKIFAEQFKDIKEKYNLDQTLRKVLKNEVENN